MDVGQVLKNIAQKVVGSVQGYVKEKTSPEYVKAAIERINKANGPTPTLISPRANVQPTLIPTKVPVQTNPYQGYANVTPPPEISKLVLEAAGQNDIPPQLLASLLWSESGYKPNAVNVGEGSVDRGIAQINSKANPHITESQAFDPRFAIKFAAEELARNKKYFSGDINRALAAYNVGRGGASIQGPELYGGGPKGQTYLEKIAGNLTPEYVKQLGLKVKLK